MRIFWRASGSSRNRYNIFDFCFYFWKKEEMKYIKLNSGHKFNQLTVIKLDNYKKFPMKNGYFRKKEYYLCECDCGNTTIVEKNNLLSGHTKSCGCHKIKTSILNGKNKKIHGLSNSRIFNIWHGIKNRCFNKNDKKKFSLYGGRGINMCDEWKNSFENFYSWAKENGYKENLTIDRIDVNGNYCPENCRWITNKEQQNNKRNNHIIEYNQKKYTISQFCEKYNMPKHIVLKRLKSGWNLKDIIETPIRGIK